MFLLHKIVQILDKNRHISESTATTCGNFAQKYFSHCDDVTDGRTFRWWFDYGAKIDILQKRTIFAESTHGRVTQTFVYWLVPLSGRNDPITGNALVKFLARYQAKLQTCTDIILDMNVREISNNVPRTRNGVLAALQYGVLREKIKATVVGKEIYYEVIR